jgi:hypothetical protein
MSNPRIVVGMLLACFVSAGTAFGAAAPAVVAVPDSEELPAGQLQGVVSGFDLCAKNSSSIFRLNSQVGLYVLYHYEGQKLSLLEQGLGSVTASGNMISFRHSLMSIPDFDTIQATFDTGANSAHVDVFGADEAHGGTVPKFAIEDLQVSNDSVCAQYGAYSALNEGVVRYYQSPSGGAVGASDSLTDATILQHYKLNDNFSGYLTRLTFLYAGKTGTPSKALGFFPVVYSDDNGKPGSRLYLGGEIRYSDVPSNPSGFVVQQRLRLHVSNNFWVGGKYDPQTDPLYFNFSSNTASPRVDVALCDPTGPCAVVNGPNSSFPQIRNLYQSVDFAFDNGAGSVGFTPITLYGNSTDVVSSKCRGAYIRVDNTANGLYSTYTEGGSPGLTETGYDNAWARVTYLGDAGAVGLSGGKSTYAGGKSIFGLSYTIGSSLKFCSRPEQYIDWTCRTTPGYAPGTGAYTRIVPITAGFELSYGNKTADRIDRYQWSLNGSTWAAQTLNPVVSSSGIVNPEFGGAWHAAVSYKVGDSFRIGYEYKNTQGSVEFHSFGGNQDLGTIHIATDTLNGFNPSEASQWTGACSWGMCTMGRFETKTGNNIIDVLDFNHSTPSVESYTLGKGVKGVGYGRAAVLFGTNAAYANFESTSTPGQVRLQLTNFHLDTEHKDSLSYDYAASGTKYPLSLAFGDGDLSLSHTFGVSLFRQDAGGCTILPVLGRGIDNNALGGPCDSIAIVGGR